MRWEKRYAAQTANDFSIDYLTIQRLAPCAAAAVWPKFRWQAWVSILTHHSYIASFWRNPRALQADSRTDGFLVTIIVETLRLACERGEIDDRRQ